MDYEKLLLALIDKIKNPYTNRDKIIQAFREFVEELNRIKKYYKKSYQEMIGDIMD